MNRRKKNNLLVVLALAAFVPIAFAGFRAASYTVRQASVPTGADGSALARPALAVEFVVTSADRFPARALDPVLHVGNLELRDYRYADISNNALIFTLFEPVSLPDNVPVYLQYGNDTRTRTDLPRFYRSMIKPLTP
jgi:hypothetical protein